MPTPTAAEGPKPGGGIEEPLHRLARRFRATAPALHSAAANTDNDAHNATAAHFLGMAASQFAPSPVAIAGLGGTTTPTHGAVTRAGTRNGSARSNNAPAAAKAADAKAHRTPARLHRHQLIGAGAGHDHPSRATACAKLPRSLRTMRAAMPTEPLSRRHWHRQVHRRGRG